MEYVERERTSQESDSADAASPVVMDARRWRQPEFGRRLKELRLQRDMRQSALAGDGMSAGYLSRLERGERPPTARAVAYLARRLGVAVEVFDTGRAAADPGSELPRLLAAAATLPGPDLGRLERTLVQALEEAADHTPELRGQALWKLAQHAAAHGQHDREVAWLTSLLSLEDELRLPGLQIQTRLQLARSHRETGRPEQALGHAQEALRMAQEQRVGPEELVALLLVLISAEADGGRLADAAHHVEELLGMVDGTSDVLAAKSLWTAATVRIRQGDTDAALRHIEDALARLDSHDDLMLWMRLRLAAASLYLRIGEPRTEPAKRRLEEARATVELIGTELHRQEHLTLRAHLAFAEGDIPTARKLCAELDGEATLLAFHDRVRLDVLRGRLMILDGRESDGAQLLKSLAEEAQNRRRSDIAAEIWRLVAEMYAPTPDAR
jgi:transcriptional regulator with XRE-family HTH domain